jgi:sugar-phosphatase
MALTEIDFDALLFDMDGVLIDSTPAVDRVWTRWATEHGFEPLEVVRRAHGRPSIANVRDYLPSADHEAENRIIERAEMDDLEGVAPLPGVCELLSSLPNDRWAIVTSSTKPLAEIRLRVAGLPKPSVLVTSSDIVNGKPHPEPYLKAAAKLGFVTNNCVVFEDAPAGIQAGKAAGSRVIAFRTTADDSGLKTAGADWIVDDIRQVHITSKEKGLRLGLAAGLTG